MSEAEEKRKEKLRSLEFTEVKEGVLRVSGGTLPQNHQLGLLNLSMLQDIEKRISQIEHIIGEQQVAVNGDDPEYEDYDEGLCNKANFFLGDKSRGDGSVPAGDVHAGKKGGSAGERSVPVLVNAQQDPEDEKLKSKMLELDREIEEINEKKRKLEEDSKSEPAPAISSKKDNVRVGSWKIEQSCDDCTKANKKDFKKQVKDDKLIKAAVSKKANTKKMSKEEAADIIAINRQIRDHMMTKDAPIPIDVKQRDIIREQIKRDEITDKNFSVHVHL